MNKLLKLAEEIVKAIKRGFLSIEYKICIFANDAKLCSIANCKGSEAWNNTRKIWTFIEVWSSLNFGIVFTSGHLTIGGM